jgi:hypothetical protein
MRKKLFELKIIFAAILVYSGYSSFSQNVAVVPPAPNAMKMTEYYAQHPNMYTGTATVAVPFRSSKHRYKLGRIQIETSKYKTEKQFEFRSAVLTDRQTEINYQIITLL